MILFFIRAGGKSPLFSQVKEKLYYNENKLYCFSGYCHYENNNNNNNNKNDNNNNKLYLTLILQIYNVIKIHSLS